MTTFRPGFKISWTRPLFTFTVCCGLISAGLQLLSADEGKVHKTGDIDIKASRVYVFVGKVGLGHEHAIIGQLKAGAVHLGAKGDAGKIVFDMPTFVADTAEARKYIGLKGTTSDSMQRDVTNNMVGADVLDVRRFPTATFEINSAVNLKTNSANNHPQYRLHGDFTLHGVKKPLQFDAEAIEQGGQVRLIGSFRIQQTAFGITPYSKAFGTVGVTDELTIYGDIKVNHTAAAAGRTKVRN